MKKLIMYDFDGLLVNSEEVVYEAIHDLFRQYNHQLTWNHFSKTIGTPVKDALEKFYKDLPLPISFQEFYKKRDEITFKYLSEKLKLMPGAIDSLHYFSHQNIPLALVTSGKRDYITHNLTKFNIAHYFHTVVCIEDVTRGKPHPDLILKALEITNTDPIHAFIFEDSPHGIEAARRAGIKSVAVPTKGIDRNLYNHADIIINSLESYQDILTQLSF